MFKDSNCPGPINKLLRVVLALCMLYLPAFRMSAADAVIENSEISGNASGGNGGGLYIKSSDANVVNNTVVDNEAQENGGGIAFGDNKRPKLYNNIFWYNRAAYFGDIFNPSPYIRNSDIQQPGYAGKDGNISSSPLFKGTNDYRLNPTSPAIDAGDPGAAPLSDKNGARRGSTVDMGAYEQAPLTSTYYVSDSSGSDNYNGLAAAYNASTGDGPKKTIQAALNQAFAGDTVNVAAGTYKGLGNKELDFKGKDIKLLGAGAVSTIIDCENIGRGFYFHSGETSEALISDFTVQNGLVSGSVPFGCGGAFLVMDSSPSLKDLIIKSNVAEWGGALELNNSGTSLVNVQITGNTAQEEGGGIYVLGASNVSITNATICDNTEVAMGGQQRPAVSNNLLAITIANSILERLHFLDSSPSRAVMTYSCVKGGFTGTGNITWTESMKMFTAENVYDLHPLSVAIDSANAAVAPSGDLRGRARYEHSYAANGSNAGTPPIDMGAYEFNASLDDPPSTTKTLTLSTAESSSISYTVTNELTSAQAASGSVSSAGTQNHALAESVYKVSYAISGTNYQKTVLLQSDIELALDKNEKEIDLGEISSYKRYAIKVNYHPYGDTLNSVVYEDEYATVYETSVTLTKGDLSSRNITLRSFSGTPLLRVEALGSSYTCTSRTAPVLVNLPIGILNLPGEIVFDLYYNTSTGSVATTAEGGLGAIDTYKRYKVEVTHSPSGGTATVESIYDIYEGDSGALTDGELSITSASGNSEISLNPPAGYILSGYSPSSFTVPENANAATNTIAVTASYVSASGPEPTYLATSAALLPGDAVCTDTYGGSDPALSGSDLTGGSAIDTRMRYKIQLDYSTGTSSTICYGLEGDLVSFSENGITISGSGYPSLPLEGNSNMLLLGFTPTGPLTLGSSCASSTNIVSVLVSYANHEASSGAVLPSLSGGNDPNLSGSALENAGAIDTRKRYQAVVNYSNGAESDNFYMLESDIVTFSKASAIVTGEGYPATYTLKDFPSMQYQGFSPTGPITANDSAVSSLNRINTTALYTAETGVVLPQSSLCDTGFGGTAPLLDSTSEVPADGGGIDTRMRFKMDIAYKNDTDIQEHNYLYGMEGDAVVLTPDQIILSGLNGYTSAFTQFTYRTVTNYTFMGSTTSAAQLNFNLAKECASANNEVIIYANYILRDTDGGIIETAAVLDAPGIDTWKRFVYDIGLETEASGSMYNFKVKWQPQTNISTNYQTVEHIIVRNNSPGAIGTVTFPERVGKGQVLSGNAYVVHVGNIITDDLSNNFVLDPVPTTEATYTYRIYTRLTDPTKGTQTFMEDQASLSISSDSDNDGLSDSDEINIYHTNPFKVDTDGDGYSDAAEVQAGTDPNDNRIFLGQRLVLSSSALDVPENSTGSVSVALAVNPSVSETLNISFVSGDTSLRLVSPARLVFTSANWSQAQSITFAADKDADRNSVYAIFKVSSARYGEAEIIVSKIDTDVTLTVLSAGNGTVTPDGTTTLTVNSQQTITATPEAGYHFDSWTGDVPEGMGNTNPLQLTLGSSANLAAHFSKNDVSYRASLTADSIPYDWVSVINNANGGWQSDVSLYGTTSEVNAYVDSMALTVNGSSVMSDGFESNAVDVAPANWTAQFTDNGSIRTVDSPSAAGSRALRVKGTSTQEQGVYYASTKCDNDSQLSFSAYLPSGMSSGSALVVWHNGVAVNFVANADGTFNAYLGASTNIATSTLCAESLSAGAWHSFVLNFDKFVDTDQDGLDDEWEMLHFGNLNQNGNGDFDNDGVSNLQEFLDQTNPCAANAKISFSLERSTVNKAAGTLSIGVELTQSSASTVSAVVKILKATATPGSDFSLTSPQLVSFAPGETSKTITMTILNNAGEEQPEEFVVLGLLRQKGANLGTYPKHTVYIEEGEGADSDNDQLPDWWEIKYFGNLNQTANGDPDNDQLSNLEEYLIGGHPNAGRTVDTNNTDLKLNIFAPLR